MDEFAQLGIGGLFAITVIKTLLPYVKPAKNGHVAKEVCDSLRPVLEAQNKNLEKQTNILDTLKGSSLIIEEKVRSDHEAIKGLVMGVHDNRISLDAVHKRMDRGEK